MLEVFDSIKLFVLEKNLEPLVALVDLGYENGTISVELSDAAYIPVWKFFLISRSKTGDEALGM